MKAKISDTPDPGNRAKKGICAKRFRGSPPFMGI